MNYNYKNYKDIRYVTQEEIDKMSHNEKFLTCKCGKKEEFRWKESDLSYHKGKGIFYSVKPFKGKNGEELCHKCAPCARCGKEACRGYENGFYEYERTNDSPSGEWILSYCSKECLERREKPNLPKGKEQEQPKYTISCDHCGKSKKVGYNPDEIYGNSYTGKMFCSENCYEAATGRKLIYDKVSCHICSRVFELKSLSKEEIDNGWCMATNCQFYCSKICFQKWRDGWTHIGSSSSNPATPTPQPITNSNDKNDDNSVKVNPGNSPKPNPGKEDSPSEAENNVKTFRFENKENDNKDNSVKTAEKSSNKTDGEVLTIQFKNVKKITLRADGKLEIEFNTEKESNINQTITDKQMSQSQELQKIKDYLQRQNKQSISQQELNSVLNSNSTSTKKPKDNNMLLIGGTIAGALIIGIGIGLFLKRRKKISKKVN